MCGQMQWCCGWVVSVGTWMAVTHSLVPAFRTQVNTGAAACRAVHFAISLSDVTHQFTLVMQEAMVAVNVHVGMNKSGKDAKTEQACAQYQRGLYRGIRAAAGAGGASCRAGGSLQVSTDWSRREAAQAFYSEPHCKKKRKGLLRFPNVCMRLCTDGRENVPKCRHIGKSPTQTVKQPWHCVNSSSRTTMCHEAFRLHAGSKYLGFLSTFYFKHIFALYIKKKNPHIEGFHVLRLLFLSSFSLSLFLNMLSTLRLLCNDLIIKLHDFIIIL